MKGRVAAILLALSVLLINACSDSGNTAQPILYNHKIHVETAGLACPVCHAQVQSSQKASIPNIEVCRGCHEEAMTESKEEAKLVAYIKKNERIPWIQVHRVPGHAYFSHRRHVAIAKIDCAQCHGDVAQMTLPFTKPHVPIKMAFCTDCHEKRRAETDCAACHR